MIGAPTGVAQGLEALRKGGVAPKLLIIDDGWQSTQLDEALRPVTETGAAKSENKVSDCRSSSSSCLHPVYAWLQLESIIVELDAPLSVGSL